MNNLIIDYRDILIKGGLLPLERWNKFDFLHIKPNSIDTKKENNNKLKNEVSNKSGLYLYKQKSEILYIGKAKPLINRLYMHYRESFEEVPGDTKTKKWHRFFSEYNGELTILWIEVKEETDRQIYELILQEIYKPIFHDYQ